MRNMSQQTVHKSIVLHFHNLSWKQPRFHFEKINPLEFGTRNKYHFLMNSDLSGKGKCSCFSLPISGFQKWQTAPKAGNWSKDKATKELRASETAPYSVKRSTISPISPIVAKNTQKVKAQTCTFTVTSPKT